jgi:hypothetical protein
MDLSDSPGGLACPSRASSWVTHPPRGISRVASLSLYRHAVAITPVRPWLGSFRSPVGHDSGLPHHLAGSAPTFGFSRPAQRSLTLRPACSRNHQVVLCIEGFGDFVTSTAAPIATGWSESCRVGIAPTEDRHLCTAHKMTSQFNWSSLISHPYPSNLQRLNASTDGQKVSRSANKI